MFFVFSTRARVEPRVKQHFPPVSNDANDVLRRNFQQHITFQQGSVSRAVTGEEGAVTHSEPYRMEEQKCVCISLVDD